MKILFVSIFIIGLLFASSCMGGVTSAYILTEQYTNPESNQTEQINIPVSQYVYDNTNVGDKYEITVHTMMLGIKTPLLNGGNSRIAVADTTPIMLMIFAIGFLFFSFYKVLISRKWKVYHLIAPIIFLGIVLLMTTTIEPDFVANGIIVDKNFVISSY